MDAAAGPTTSATAWERLFMECDTQGRVLWMNQRARLRLGLLESLPDALPASQSAEMRWFLSSREPGPQPRLISSFRRQGRNENIPVQLVRLIALGNRVVLSAELRARATDRLESQREILRILLEMQSRAVQNYFRLRKLQEALEKRAGAAARPVGAVLAEAIEMERTRTARELHSGVGQTLAGIKMNLELMESRLPGAPSQVSEAIRRIYSLAEDALGEIRHISQRLYRPDWQRLSLPEAIELLWQTMGIPDKFHAKLEIHSMESELPDAVRFTIYRSVQEGLANVLRHARATEVKIELAERAGSAYLALEDNGNGFDVHELIHGAPSLANRGIGLRAMREEVYALSGVFKLTSGPGGTRMEIMLPIAENR